MFEVPLAFLCDHKPAARGNAARSPASSAISAFTYQDREIWGATAAIAVNLAERLSDITES